jgi:hypothetical protein
VLLEKKRELSGETVMGLFLCLLGGLQILDGILTQFIVGYGLVGESNPLVIALIKDGNFLWLKILGAVLSVVIMYLIHRRFPRLALVAISSMVAFYGAVAFWNMLVLVGG